MYHYLLAVSLTLLVLFGWVAVQHVARVFAARHPEWGSYREEGECGSGCGQCHAVAHCHHKPEKV